jgi:hypothetical protein
VYADISWSRSQGLHSLNGLMDREKLRQFSMTEPLRLPRLDRAPWVMSDGFSIWNLISLFNPSFPLVLPTLPFPCSSVPPP